MAWSMSSTSRWTLLLISALTLLSTGCRSGDESACTDREVRQCARAEERDAVEIVFARQDYGTCREAVSDGACGIDAEALRRCVDALPTPLCVGAPYQHVDARILFETTACADELDTYLECQDEDDYSSSSSSSSDDDDWYDD